MFYQKVTTCECGSNDFKATATKQHEFSLYPEFEEVESDGGVDDVTDLLCAKCGKVALSKDKFTQREIIYMLDGSEAAEGIDPEEEQQ